MRITLKDILSDNIFKLFFLIFITSSYARADQNILLIQNGYGTLYWGSTGEHHDKPEIYSHLDSFRYKPDNEIPDEIEHTYSISSIESDKNKSTYDFNLHLKIQIKSEDVLAKITFNNNSKAARFINKKYVPFDFKSKISSRLCDTLFFIRSDNVKLDYLGSMCNYGSTFDRHDWLEIPAKTNLSFTIKLNDAYAFLPGKKHYDIETREYLVVDNNWLIQGSIDKLFFTILNWRVDCETVKNEESTSTISDQCNSSHNEDNIENFLAKHSYYHESKGGFIIRSNNVSTFINGDKIKSIYAN
ncbi:hypothetical protein [Rahnella aquatilis]|uniref:hypothetical protein n=1 Tax=Rahnella aquatilis TaxID=34038 RepID=UPI000648D63D|nr:hypothetical protein [Rahnella aquatilis]